MATYVIGIRDRHNDNIMIGDQGEIIHIDYGHILDHRKQKMGVNREYTDFILTPEFIKVFAHGEIAAKRTKLKEEKWIIFSDNNKYTAVGA